MMLQRNSKSLGFAGSPPTLPFKIRLRQSGRLVLRQGSPTLLLIAILMIVRLSKRTLQPDEPFLNTY